MFIIINFLILSLIPLSSGNSENSWWDHNWSFRQEITIPIDTSTSISKFQPIDLKINFNNPCWAKNEKEHSIRVIFQKNGIMKELESQIYDLEKTDDTHISSCSIVFLIPEDADGNEKYYVYYDDKQKDPVNYKDHVDVEDAYYYFAPIPVYPFESKFFKITEDGDIVYGVAYEGELLGVGTTQQVTKFKENTKEVSTPKDIEAWASFDFFYNYGDDLRAFSSTLQNLISKQILIDGNLMVKFNIISISSKEDFETIATYTYYYNPSKDKRICINVKHEALKEAHVVANSPHTESCGNIGGLQIGAFKSPSIKELNFGRMYPYMHVYSEENIIREYGLDTDPEYNPEGIPILKTKDDVDLGKHAWASFDEGEKGTAHSFIFDTTNVLVSGTDERDGIQIKSFEYSPPRVLGLEIDLASYYFTRNSYEKGSENDLIIPKDYSVEYNAEFFSASEGGYKTVDNEATIFQKLVKQRPISKDDQRQNKQEKQNEKYNLTTYVHLAPSFPLGTTLSILTGKKFSYITGELYKDGELLLTGIGERISLNEIPDFDNKSLPEKIKLLRNVFDLKNISFSKKIRFNNLEKGTYLIKIYKVHPLLGKERKYIGFKIIDLEKNTKTHIFCKQQRSINISTTDQKGEKVGDVKVKLNYKNMTISEGETSDGGYTTISAPYTNREKYNLLLIYKGFLIHEEQIKLGVLKGLKTIKKSFEIERYNLNLNIKDTWDETPSYKLNPVLTSDKMIDEYLINADTASYSKYVFNNLPSNEYTLQIDYKSFNLKKKITINEDKEYDIVFPAEFEITIHVYDSRGSLLENSLLKIKRNDKTREIKSGKNSVIKTILPPGTYKLEIYDSNQKIAERNITVIGQRTFDVVTTKEPIFPLIATICLLIFLILSSYLFLFRKKDKILFLKTLAIILVLIAVVQPWWNMHGFSDNKEIQISSSLYLIPSELTTLTQGSNVNAGELGLKGLSKIITNVMMMLTVAILISCILITVNIVLKKYNKKRLSQITFILGILVLIISIGVFCYTTSQMAEVGLGGLLGEGEIELKILGEGENMIINTSWGPSVGFYLCLISIFLLMIILSSNIKTMIKRVGGIKNTINKRKDN